MRLIDADALIEDVKTLWDYETVDGITSSTVLKQIVTDIQNAPTISAPRWVRCEEPPKEDGWYMLCYLSRWKNGSWWIPNFPDYWVEPPKEDV